MFELFKFIGYCVSNLYNTLNFKIVSMAKSIGFMDFLIGCSLILVIFKYIMNKDKGVI